MLKELKLDLLEGRSIGHGSHDGPDSGMCVMEAVAYVAGEPWSDHPECACPVITEFMIRWNDGLPDDDTRDRLFKAGQPKEWLVAKLAGTRGSKELEERRRFMIIDWQMREALPIALEASERLKPIAAELRALPEIKTWSDFDKAVASITKAKKEAAAAWDAARAAAWAAARDAAWDDAWDAARAAAWDAARAAAMAAARDAARDAARAAAWDAAWDAARAAAWAAARAAAWDAARDAARAAAWDAARAAAWDAAWDAARAALRGIIERSQQSAVRLVERMCALQE